MNYFVKDTKNREPQKGQAFQILQIIFTNICMCIKNQV